MNGMPSQAKPGAQAESIEKYTPGPSVENHTICLYSRFVLREMLYFVLVLRDVWAPIRSKSKKPGEDIYRGRVHVNKWHTTSLALE